MKINTKLIFSLLIFTLTSIIATGRVLAEADGPDYYRVHGVADNDVLNIHTKADYKSTKIGEIPPGAGCVRNLGCKGGLTLDEFSSLSKQQQKTVLKKRPRWCLIEYQKIKGWVSGRYLAEGSCDIKRHSSSAIELELQRLLENHSSEMIFSDWHGISVYEKDRWIAAAYHDSAFSPYWITKNGPGHKAQILLNALHTSAVEGLEPQDYGVSVIDALWKSTSPQDHARLDVMLTVAYIEYITDIRHGRVQPKKEDEALFYHKADKQINAVNLMDEVKNNKDFKSFLLQQLPSHQLYQLTREGLARYKDMASAGGWSQIAAGPSIHPGAVDKRVTGIRQRLMISGDLTKDNSRTPEMDAELYDNDLAAAVKLFQSRHGLTADGIIGKGTISAMNVSADYRVQQIEMNLERWRWMDRDLGQRYVIVDIPSYTVSDYQNDEKIYEMPVIVGMLHHDTPVFSEEIKYVVLNPYWTLTPHIARTETLHKLRKDRHYLKKNHISLFKGWNDPHELDATRINWHKVSPREMNKYRFRQNPGPWNALGVLKIVFPNKHSVYMHDTPNHKLFKREVRGFSHGCIRMSNPVKQASIVLGDEWTEERLNELIASGKRTVIRLDQPMKVHLVYQTAWGDENGRMHFVRDIYARDKGLHKALYL